MSSETLYQAPRKCNVSKMRVHDYLYDSSYIVSGARDYARTAFKAAMDSAQVGIQPIYNTMFSELRKFPRVQVVYHPNCRLPQHIDRSYAAYVDRSRETARLPQPHLTGRDRFIFSAVPRQVLALKSATPDFRPPSAAVEHNLPTRPVNRGMQTVYRESSAQTRPWQPPGVQAGDCVNTPEVLYLENMDWGPGESYRLGDLPADFHTTEIINKMRHARAWMGVAEKGKFPNWMKRRDAIITDVETRDWLFREAEIDELQDIRLALLHKLQAKQRTKQMTRASRKLDKLWQAKKVEMERKISAIRRTRDREVRKLSMNRGGAGARSEGAATRAARDPTSDVHAPAARHGYQARGRHAAIHYDLTLLEAEDHEILSAPPPWLQQCGQNLKKTCSGHHLAKDTTQLCERETKWSEKYLENLHNDLKKARLGAAATSAAPLRVLKPRHVPEARRPSTAEVAAVTDAEEACHQAALLLQRVMRGRAVQNLMYEGRSRASELIEELKSTHGLQLEDKARIAKEETKARDYDDVRTQADKKEAAVSALVEEVCGGAVAAALHFLDKELRRLLEERRQHAFILIALREKTMREAAEAGRRQKEEHRRREHDEMFRQILGVTQETVDLYFHEAVQAGVGSAAETDAQVHVEAEADRIDAALQEYGSMSTAEQNEMVAELVHQFLLPEAHRAAARAEIDALQRAGLDAARRSIFGVLDDAEIKQQTCKMCGAEAAECRCAVCPLAAVPTETMHRHDPRWKYARHREEPPTKSVGEKFPPQHEFRCMLNTLVDEVVVKSRQHKADVTELCRELGHGIRERVEVELDARAIMDTCVSDALGLLPPKPLRPTHYRHSMMRRVDDAMGRSVPFQPKKPCAQALPSEQRRERSRLEPADTTCLCDSHATSRIKFIEAEIAGKDLSQMLPSELRVLEDMRRCKCDTDPAPSPVTTELDTMAEEEASMEPSTSPPDDSDD